MSGSDYPVDATTGGSVAGFTPNMTPAQVAEYDRRRGMGDMGAFNDPDLIVNKQPWLKPDGTHKGMDKTKEATDILRAMRVPEGDNFAKEKDMDFTDKLFGKAVNTKTVNPGLDRQRERSSGRKERSIAMRHLGKGEVGELTSEKDDVDVLERLLDHEKKEMNEEQKAGKAIAGMTTLGPRGVGGGGGGGVGATPTPAPPPPAPSAGPRTGSMLPGELAKSPMDTLKALTSRSMHIPRPAHAFDPWSVFENASHVPVSSAQTFEGAALTMKSGGADETCATHGVTFRKETGCAQCKIAKCHDCEKCGAGMHKSIGGTYQCPRGH